MLGEPLTIDRDDRTGLPVVSVGRRVTSADVADLLDEEPADLPDAAELIPPLG
jgi:hypothetical protein